MGICWGSPNFPTPSFGRSFRDGTVSICSFSSYVISLTIDRFVYDKRSLSLRNRHRSPGIDLTVSSTPSDTASSAITSSYSSRTTSDGAVAIPEVLNSAPSSEQLRVFKYVELKAMTENFSCSLGETRFDGRDIVHSGLLKAGSMVETAIKVMEFPRKPSRQQRLIVRAKFESYGRLSHPNLIRLLGYCLNDRKLLLVYESPRHYFTLEDVLYKSPSDMLDKREKALPPLPWHRRLQMALEAAQGLSHLHLMDQTFLQYFQASYVLLDRFYAVKIAPFNFLVTGLSDNAGRMSKNIIGIEIGDEAATVDRRRQDVYDFGVVLLEILTGLALGRNRWSPEYGSRIEWIITRVLDRDNLVTLMDSNMGSYPLDDAFQVTQLAVGCLGQDPLQRPTMPQVEETLRQIKAAEISLSLTTESGNSMSSDQREGLMQERVSSS